jgi:tetratricopeptide (TPR) repeat protein
LNRLGQAEQALAACEDARKIFADAGDRDSVARVLVTSGSVLEEQGQFASAKARYQEALAIHGATGDQAGVALALNVLAVLNVDSGNYANAKTMYEQSTSIARKNGDQDAVILGLGNLANLLLLEGDLKEARPIYEDMLAICRRLDSKDRIALQLGNLGVLLFLQGDLSGAQKAFEESAALDLRAGNKRQLGDDLSNLGDVFQAQAKLPEARQKRSESLAVRTQITDKVGAANIRVAFAQSSIEEGHPTEAIEPLRQAIADLKELKSEDDEASTYPVLARALLLAGNHAEALKVIESGAGVASKSHDRMVQFSFAIAEAQVKAANGQIASADESLTRIIAETKKAGFVGYELEARLALAEIQLRSARTATAQARLAAVEKDARSKGFLLIAHKAAILKAAS